MTLWHASPPQGHTSEQGLSILTGLPIIAPPQGKIGDSPLTGTEMLYEDLDIMTYEDGTVMEYEHD